MTLPNGGRYGVEVYVNDFLLHRNAPRTFFYGFKVHKLPEALVTNVYVWGGDNNISTSRQFTTSFYDAKRVDQVSYDQACIH